MCDALLESSIETCIPEVYNYRDLPRGLVHRGELVGRYGIIEETEQPKNRIFQVKPLGTVPLMGTALADYLEREFNHVNLRIYPEGEIWLTLGPNQYLQNALSSVAWAYARLLRLPKKARGNENDKKTASN